MCLECSVPFPESSKSSKHYTTSWLYSHKLYMFFSLISADLVCVHASVWRSEVHVKCSPRLLSIRLVLLRQGLSLEPMLTHKSAKLEDQELLNTGVTDTCLTWFHTDGRDADSRTTHSYSSAHTASHLSSCLPAFNTQGKPVKTSIEILS